LIGAQEGYADDVPSSSATILHQKKRRNKQQLPSSSSSSSSAIHTADRIAPSLIGAQEGDADDVPSSNSSALTTATKFVRCHSGSRCRSVDKIDGAGNHSVNSDIPVDH